MHIVIASEMEGENHVSKVSQKQICALQHQTLEIFNNGLSDLDSQGGMSLNGSYDMENQNSNPINHSTIFIPYVSESIDSE